MEFIRVKIRGKAFEMLEDLVLLEGHEVNGPEVVSILERAVGAFYCCRFMQKDGHEILAKKGFTMQCVDHFFKKVEECE